MTALIISAASATNSQWC